MLFEDVYTTSTEKAVLQLEQEIAEKKKELAALRKKVEPKVYPDYTFKDKLGKEVKLSELFGNATELLLVQNMGKSCPYCTLWADEYNGVVDHLNNRVPFVVISPDEPAEMKTFAESRNWKFNILSSAENTFKKDSAFERANGEVLPGVMVFQKDKEGILREYSRSSFGPGDNFCSVWDYFDLLPEGVKKWHPKYSY